MIWYLALVIGVPVALIVILLIQDARRRKRTHVNEAESAYRAQRDLYDEIADIKTGVGRAMRDVDLYNGAKSINRPRGR
jgi:septal ring-binding cell division protein DamX